MKWMNENEGVLSVGIFITTLLLGWVSGIFAALRRKPKFKIELFDGPTFSCTYWTGKTLGDDRVQRTAIALYLHITNVGSAPSSVEDISIGYHWHLLPFSKLWLRYSIGWCWLRKQAVALSDFHAYIGDQIKVFPFLTQKNSMTDIGGHTYLEPGMSTNGVIYYETGDDTGGNFPSPRNGQVKIKVKVNDAFGKGHSRVFRIPLVSLDKAREYNPSFGNTRAKLRGDELPTH
ncbi:MAG: hypothetical protein JO256_05555 [Alphaproteobacteria bacterium]|nr:hypothetical protein [Alphaproteobacteria bacterium]